MTTLTNLPSHTAATPSTSQRPSLRFTVIVGAGTIVITLVIMALAGLTVTGGETASARAAGRGMSLPLIIHLATVIPALPLGAYLLVRRKGVALHKALGKLWAAMMVITAIDSFWLHDVTGGLSFIHIFSAWTLIAIPRGVMAIRKGNVKAHDRTMTGLYIGLVIAGLFAFMPGRILGALVFG